MKAILFGFACLLCWQLDAQNFPKNPNHTDKQGRRQGRWTILMNKNWHPTPSPDSAAFFRVITYKDDKPLGTVTDYYRSGKKQWQGELLADRPTEIPNGVVTVFNENEIALQKIIYQNGVPNGPSQEFWEDGQLKIELSYNHGKFNGLFRRHRPTGTLQEERTYVNGVLEGPARYYDTEGNKVSEGNYINNKPSADWKFFGESIECLQFRANYLIARGEYYQAIPWLRQAAEKIERVSGKNSLPYLKNLQTLGLATFNSEQVKASNDLDYEVLRLAKQFYKKNSMDFFTVYNNLGASNEFLQNIHEAEKYYLLAMQVLEDNHRTNGYDYILIKNNYARLITSINSKLALKLFQENLESLEKLNLTKDSFYSVVQQNLGWLYITLGDYKNAEYHLNRALKSPDFPNGMPLNALTDLYINERRFTKAKNILKQDSAEISKLQGTHSEPYAKTMGQMAMVNGLLQRHREALHDYEEALKGAPENSLIRASYTFRKGISHQRLREFELSKVAMTAGLDFVLHFLTTELPYQSENDKLAFYSDYQGYFDQFNHLALVHATDQPDMLARMFDYRLATKGLIINSTSQWKKAILNSGDRKLITEFNQWLELKENITKYYQMSDAERKARNIQLDSLENNLARVEKRLSERSQYFINLDEQKELTWKDIQKKLKPGEAAIEMMRVRKYGIKETGVDSTAPTPTHYIVRNLVDTIQYAALIIKADTKDHPQLVLLPNGNELEGKGITYYRNAILSQQPDELSYRLFWEKIAQAVKGTQRVYFSPDGIYHQLNLNTLFNTKTKKYLLDEIDLRLVTSSKDLMKEASPENANSYALLFGNPLYAADSPASTDARDETTRGVNYKLERGGVTFEQLPGSEAEVDKIGELLSRKGWKPEVVKGDEAREERIKSSYKPKVLHIATHGYFQNNVSTQNNSNLLLSRVQQHQNNPLVRSGLLLAGASKAFDDKAANDAEENTEDGVLTAYEAMNLNLANTELVVLSACETGLGEIKNGDGVYGLQRAFKVAGAKTIIMSLWNVNDASTQELMTLFYEHWLSGKDKHSAFREAQQTLRQHYPQSYYWGAFVMVGE